MIISLSLLMTGIKTDFFILRNMTRETDRSILLMNKRIPPPLSQQKLTVSLWKPTQVGGELEADSESEERSHN